ncbi:hypothetical protein [Pedobacter alpinus]|uniref:Uncharacterized protein n=1 Tax=Pedobacter alpinus TaxID=1590643 RepID=A0ABW5TUF6_9SPHI
MGKLNKPTKKPVDKQAEDEDEDDIVAPKSKKYEDDDDTFDGPLDDIAGFDDLGFDDDDDF